MAESFIISKSLSKKEQYQEALIQLTHLTAGERDLIANLSNIMSALKYGFGFFWVGVYMVKIDELVLGPFQGPIACTRIQKGRGVSGAAWQDQKSILVPNVDEFPGHIACSSESKSEIVIPVFDSENNVSMVFDIDSDRLNNFDEDDVFGLEQIAKLISKLS
ncbi:MAG: L-methionine (R)-S-oxide reductase [Flavobacteriales bacterium]|jgi:L-methionine (R)-S-oxide reductase